MSNNRPQRATAQDEPSRPRQVLEWAMCHPGVLVLGSLAVGTALAARWELKHQSVAERRVETEADIVDGEVPLFI